jgi:transcriptional regulator with XRE-family HTH domain
MTADVEADESLVSWSLSTSTNAVQDFADRLREEKDRAGLSYREIAAIAYRDHSQMVRAAKGAVLPSWNVTRAFLKGCGIPQHQLGPWRQLWSATRVFLEAEEKLQQAKVELAVGTSVARRGSGLRLTKDWLEVQKCNTPAQLGVALRHLLEHNGLTFRRQAAVTTGVPKSTLSDWIEGKRVPPAYRLDQLLQQIGASERAQREFAACLERIRERRWSRSAIDQLRVLCLKVPVAVVAQRLGKSEAAVREKIDELGLPRYAPADN